jgi:hypothetical protein
MTMPPIDMHGTLSRQVLDSAVESTWPSTREAEWVISEAVFGLITGVIQILVRRVVDRVDGEMEGVDRKDMVTSTKYGDVRKRNRFVENYLEYWRQKRKNIMLSKAQSKNRKRSKNRLLQNYVQNSSRAPLVIMDNEVEENMQ